MMEFQVRVRFLRNVQGWKRGDTVTVSRDAYTENLISNGIVEVLQDYRPSEPKRNAGRAAWADFLTSMGMEVHPQATRRDLIDQWDGVGHRG